MVRVELKDVFREIPVQFSIDSRCIVCKLSIQSSEGHAPVLQKFMSLLPPSPYMYSPRICPRTMNPLDGVGDRGVKTIVTERDSGGLSVEIRRKERSQENSCTRIARRYGRNGVIQSRKKEGTGRKAVGGGGPHLKLQIAILPWPWFRFCKVMLWRKVSGIYQESWYNFATTIDAMKRLAPPHLLPLFSARSLTPFSTISLTRRYSSLSPPIN